MDKITRIHDYKDINGIAYEQLGSRLNEEFDQMIQFVNWLAECILKVSMENHTHDQDSAVIALIRAIEDINYPLRKVQIGVGSINDNGNSYAPLAAEGPSQKKSRIEHG